MEMDQSPAQLIQVADHRIDWVLSHPGMSTWLKNALRTARDRDPIEVLNDLEVLCLLLKLRSESLIEIRLTNSNNI